MKAADARGISDVTYLNVADNVANELAVLRLRADSMRRLAEDQHPFVAQAYVRRAAELEFQAWLTEVSAAPAVAA